MRNRFYKLFTKEEIPDSDTRRAVNCFYANLVACDYRLDKKCQKLCHELWIKCPKQTGIRYKGEVTKND